MSTSRWREWLFAIAGVLATIFLAATLLAPKAASPPKIEHLLMHFHLAQHLCRSTEHVERRGHWCRKEVQKRGELAEAGYPVAD